MVSFWSTRRNLALERCLEIDTFFKQNIPLFHSTAMGNFYIVEAGGNGFAACKQKKNSSQGSKADKAFLPEGKNALSAFDPREEFFFLLKGGKTISTQLNFIEIAFLYEYYYDPEILFQEYLQVANS